MPTRAAVVQQIELGQFLQWRPQRGKGRLGLRPGLALIFTGDLIQMAAQLGDFHFEQQAVLVVGMQHALSHSQFDFLQGQLLDDVLDYADNGLGLRFEIDDAVVVL